MSQWRPLRGSSSRNWQRRANVQENRSSRYGDLPAYLQADLRKKRELRKLWARTRCPRVKRELNGVAAELSEAVKAWRGSCWESCIDRATDDRSELYALNRRLSNTPEPIHPLIDSAGRRCYSAQERAEIMSASLENQFRPHPLLPSTPAHIRALHL